MISFQNGVPICITNRPFQGATEGAKVYAGLGTQDLIRYRPNQVIDPNCLPANFDWSNDVSLATVTNPATDLVFTAPAAWYSRDDIWLQVRSFANDMENESIYQPRRVSMDGSGNLIILLTGTYVLLGVDPGDSGSATIRFSWRTDRSSAAVLLFAAVFVSGPLDPGLVTTVPVDGRVQRLTLTGLVPGSYSFTLEARSGSTHLVLGTVSFDVADVPTMIGSLSILEN